MPTIAIGDVHGQLPQLVDVLAQLAPMLRDDDTVVFLGDYVDRGPDTLRLGSRAVTSSASTGVSLRPWCLTCLLSLLLVSACGEATDVAHRVALDTVATEVAFDTPVSAPGGELALCVEFDLPRDSHLASSLGIVLLARDGTRTSWRGDADRTGESTVCLRGTVSPSQTYTGALVTAPRRMLLRRINWAQASS